MAANKKIFYVEYKQAWISAGKHSDDNRGVKIVDQVM